MKISQRFVRLGVLAAALPLLSSCMSNAIAKLVGTPAYYVYVTPGNPQAATNGSTVYFTVDNEGAASAFLKPCGDAPALDVQLQVNGQWQSQTPDACGTQTVPGPIEVTVAQQIVTSRVFTKGHWRVGVYVGTSAALADVAESWSVGFDIN